MRKNVAALAALLACVIVGLASASAVVTSSDTSSISVQFSGYACGTTHTFTDDTGQSVTGATAACPLPTAVPGNIQDGATVSNGDTFTVTPNQPVDSVEFWANGAQLAVDTTAPYSVVLNLPDGTNRLGVDTNNGSTRLVWGLNGTCSGCGGTYATVTVGVAPPPPPPPATYYEKQAFEGTIDAPATFSSFGGGGGPSGTGTYSFLAGGVVGQKLRLTTAATTLTNGSQGDSVFYGASRAHSGYDTGTNGKHEESWYSLDVYFPAGWRAPAGNGNWIWEWHDDTISINELTSFGKPSVSCAIGAYADGSGNNAGTNPRWEYQLNGGPTSNPNYSGRVPTTLSIQTGVWYKLLAHFIWDGSPSGLAQVWESSDGGATYQTIVDQTRATLFTRQNGTWSYNTHGFYNYHPDVNYKIDQDFDEQYIGPTRGSVYG